MEDIPDTEQITGKIKMSIELEKILAMSARDYCEMQNNILRNYTAVGVHHSHHNSIVTDFARIVPEDAEVVVDFRQDIVSMTTSSGLECIFYMASGTALIPKEG